jgi:Transposase DDE domain
MSKSKRLNRDHAKKTQRPMVEDRIIAEHLTTILTPTIKSQSRHFRELGLRDRILTLPLMVAAVLTLLWRDVPGVSELGGVHFITRIKINASIEYQKVFTDSYALRDRLVKIGSGTKKTPTVTLRLIELRKGKVWHSYLTSVLDPEVLPPYVVIDLYQKRWRIEDAFNVVKRLLGLSYLWTGEPLRWAGSPT